MDYDLDYFRNGSFDDVGSAVGNLPAGYSYELDDPNTSNIFSDFANVVGNTGLLNTNNVGNVNSTIPPYIQNDVSWALALNGLNVLPNETGVVTFTVSTTMPTTSFYLQQTNYYSASSAGPMPGDSIYLSATFTVQNNGPVSSVPEPASLTLLGIGAVCSLGYGWRRRKSA